MSDVWTAIARWSLAWPWMLAVALVLAGLAAWYRRGDRPGAWLYSSTREFSESRRGWRARLAWLPAVTRALALVLVTIAVARPQIEDFEEETVEGIDLFVVLDMSGSMAAVDMSAGEIDVFRRNYGAEPPNRFQNAIATLKQVVAQRERDRIGMVVFARDAFLQFPLTLDYTTILGLLDELALEQIDASATAIGNALGLSIRGLLDSGATSRAIILITDGKQQGGNISPMQAAQLAADDGIRIYSILVGREGPTMAPVRVPGAGVMYTQQDYPVDPELLNEMAQLTGGAFYRAENREELEAGLGEILDQLETTVLQEVSSVRRTEMFQPFVLAGLMLLALDALLRWVLMRRFP